MRRRPEVAQWWSVSREWEGETAFIIAGGPSVAGQDLEQVRGRKVIVINSSCYRVPWGDILFFMDARWWRENRRGVDGFQGRIVTSAAVSQPRALRVIKRLPERGFATATFELMHQRTSVAAALNLCAHLGARRAILLGADCKFGADGRRNHHAPHEWPHREDTWKAQRAELALTVQPLRERGIEVLNASPDSALRFWPLVKLEDCL